MKHLDNAHALLVASADSYAEEAALTVRLLSDFGAVDYFRCYISSATSPSPQSGFTAIHYKRSGNWSDELLATLAVIPESYVLLWLDDLVPIAKPNFTAIEDIFCFLAKNGGRYARLNPTPGGRGNTASQGLKVILPWEVYRTSTILSIWHKETLRSLLKPGETAWDFERKSCKRSEALSDFFASSKRLAPFENLVVKGLVNPGAESKVLSAGISTSSISRPRMSRIPYLLHRLANLRSKIARKYVDPMRRWF